MSSYHLFAVDDEGRSVHMSHIHGKPCLHIPDDEQITIILEHDSCATLIELQANGNFEVFTEEDYEWQEHEQPQIVKGKRRRGKRRRKK